MMAVEIIDGLVDEHSAARAELVFEEEAAAADGTCGDGRKADAAQASKKGARPLWLVLPGMLTDLGQRRVAECLAERTRNALKQSTDDPIKTRKAPLGLEMQAANQPICTEPLLSALALAAFELSRVAINAHFSNKQGLCQSHIDAAAGLCRSRGNLTALGWLYGPESSMATHYDSPTFPGSNDEWLVSLNVGLSMRFAANDSELLVKSGDVLVMDTLNVRHGVLGVVQNSAPESCPITDCRLGVMLWESYNPDLSGREELARQAEAAVEGVGNLFGE